MGTVSPLPTIAVPGQSLAPSSAYAAGPGTHIHASQIHASVCGPVVTIPPENNTTKGAKATLSIARNGSAETSSNGKSKVKDGRWNTLPAVDSVALARVTRVQHRQATLSILVVDPSLSASPSSYSTLDSTTIQNTDLLFPALIRREDVRAVEKDRVIMNDMFRVGDIVRAVVISLGDVQGGYYLSTAGNELGVVFARSERGWVMVPSSWRDMREVGEDGGREARKVAKPF